MKCLHCQKELSFPNSKEEYIWHLKFIKKILKGETLEPGTILKDHDLIILAQRFINSALGEIEAVL